MLACMTTADPAEWGPRLYEYLERHWKALGTNANAWTDANPGIQGPTVSRWRTGTVPSLQAMRAVADALGVPMVDVMIAAGVIDRSELDREPAAAPPEPDIDAAIAGDRRLSPLARNTLRDILASIRKVEAGEAESARGRRMGDEPAPRRRRRNGGR